MLAPKSIKLTPPRPFPTLDLPEMHILVFSDRGFFLAQCLEFDVCAQGDGPADAMKNLEATMCSQIFLDSCRQRKPFADFPKAPRKFWNEWKKTREKVMREPLKVAIKGEPQKQVHQAFARAHIALAC